MLLKHYTFPVVVSKNQCSYYFINKQTKFNSDNLIKHFTKFPTMKITCYTEIYILYIYCIVLNFQHV